MSHSVDIHVGRKLKKIRTLRRLSQTDIAQKLNLSFQQIQKYELGSNRIAASRLWELAEIFGIKVGYFFEGIEKQHAMPKETPDDWMESDEMLKLGIVYYHIPEKYRKQLFELAKSLSIED